MSDWKLGRYYSQFTGLYYLTDQDDVIKISPSGCQAYALAVLTLYHLNVFDTPHYFNDKGH